MKRKSKTRRTKARTTRTVSRKAIEPSSPTRVFIPSITEQQHFLSLASLLTLSVVYWSLFYITLDHEVRVPGENGIVYLIAIPSEVTYLYGVIAGFLTLMLGVVYFSGESSFRRAFRALIVDPSKALIGFTGRTLHVANASMTLGIIMLGLTPIFAADVYPGVIGLVLLGLGALLAASGSLTIYKVMSH